MQGKGIVLLLSVVIAIFPIFSFAGEVVLTIDDLPFVGHAKHDMAKFQRENKRFHKILSALEQEHIPATGFAIGGAIEPGQEAWLQEFRQAGNLIGNHTYSHMDLNHMSADRYIEDIARADEILTPLMSQPKYFRYPFLATGRSCGDYLKVRNFLKKNGYVVAPVTIDSKDYQFNFSFHAMPWQTRKTRLDSFRQRYLSFIEQQTALAERRALATYHRPIKQILLIHSNSLNAEFLPDIIRMFHQRGYQFVSLESALREPYYNEEARCSEGTIHR